MGLQRATDRAVVPMGNERQQMEDTLARPLSCCFTAPTGG